MLVELKARFDERNNIRWATRLESAGVHVVYGVENLKTHCKLCLVVRNESEGVRRYAHVGTGNYNRNTSWVYTDFGLFTADAEIVDDISDLFNYLTGYSKRREYQELLVAPVSLRSGVLSLLDREAQLLEHSRVYWTQAARTSCPAAATGRLARLVAHRQAPGSNCWIGTRRGRSGRPPIPDPEREPRHCIVAS